MNLIKQLLKLYTDYKELESTLSASEFLTVLNEDNSQFIKINHNDLNQHFLQLTKHEKFLRSIASDFMRSNYLSYLNLNHVTVILYVLLFALTNENCEIFLHNFLHMNCFYLCKLLAMIMEPSKHLFLCQMACKYFEDEYVLERIIYPLLNNIPVLSELANQLETLYTVRKKPVTKFKLFNFVETKSVKKVPPPPANTPPLEPPGQFRASRIPRTNRQKDMRIEKKLLESQKYNRIRAEKLLDEAKNVSKRLTDNKKIFTEKPQPLVQKIERRSIPVFKPVKIKGNLSTTLRDVSRILRNQESEVQRIDNLIKGGFNQAIISDMEEQIRKEMEQKELEKIEKNHLKGLLSYEEAILAKKRLLDLNRMKMDKFKEEKSQLMDELERWRDKEQIKIKQLVEKSHNIKMSAKENEQKMREQKQQQVRLQLYETKQMLEKAMEQNMLELKRKIELIKEIKAIHQLYSLRLISNEKEFDRTEPPNLGLLCEMSIAELQERLAIVKMEMLKELKMKRERIMKEREERKGMIDNLNKIIACNREEQQMINDGKKGEVASKQKRQREIVMGNPDVMALKKLLDEKRQLRHQIC